MCQCIRLEVVRNGWSNDEKVLDSHRRGGEGVVGYNNRSNQDREMAKYLMSTARRGGSRVQQHIQPRQSDDGSTLLKMEAVQNGWGDAEGAKQRERGKGRTHNC